MQSNGWIFYDRIHLSSRDWSLTLQAFAASVEAGREASLGWPPRETTEGASGIRAGDQMTIFANAKDAVAEASGGAELLSVQWDISQLGSDQSNSVEWMKIRACELTAKRGSGLTLYASSPNEPDVVQLLAAVRHASEPVLSEDKPRSGWLRRLFAVDKD